MQCSPLFCLLYLSLIYPLLRTTTKLDLQFKYWSEHSSRRTPERCIWRNTCSLFYAIGKDFLLRICTIFVERISIFLPKPILGYFWNWCILRFTYYIAMQESDIISICLFPSVSCCNIFLIETPTLKIRTWHFFTCISTLNDFINWYLKLWMTQYLLLFIMYTQFVSTIF